MKRTSNLTWPTTKCAKNEAYPETRHFLQPYIKPGMTMIEICKTIRTQSYTFAKVKG